MLKLHTLLLVGFMLVVCAVTGYSQAVGDFGSVADGNWGTLTTWKKWDGSGWNTTPTAAPDTTTSVWIVANHKVVLEASAKNCRDLNVESGVLFADSALPTSGIRYIRVNGNVTVTGGVLGGTTTSGGRDVLSLEYYKDMTIGGSGGQVSIARIRPRPNVKNVTLTIDRDMQLSYSGSTGTGGVALYTAAGGNDNITVTVNSGKTVTVVDNGFIGIASDARADSATTTAFNIDGTVNMLGPNGTLSLRVASGKTSTLNLAGTFNVAKNLYTAVPGTGTMEIYVPSGGLLRVGTGGSGSADFSNPANFVSGGGTFTLDPGALLTIGSPDGITATAATGPIQTATRNYSSTAIYEYAGKAAQVTGDGLPASVAGLTINDSLGVTLTNNLTVTGAVTFTAGKLATGTKAIRALGTVVSAGPGKFVSGKLHRLMNAPGAVKWDVGNENDYLPFSVYIKTISGGDTVGLSIVDRRVVPPTAKIRDTSKVLRRYARLTNVDGIVDLKSDSMTIRYADADVIAAGLREDTLKVYSSDGVFWSASRILGIDTVNNTIKVDAIESPVEVIVSGVAPQFSGTVKDARLAPNGTEVAFLAIVTRTKGAFTYMQDTTAGMTVRQTSGAWFDSLASGAIRPGTVVRVLGVTSEFNGLKQINTTDLKGFSIAWQDPLPQPRRLTLAQLNAGGENYEAMLVKVVSVKVIPGADTVYLAAKTYNITDPTDTTKAVSLRIPNAADSDVDGKKIIPVITFTGVVGQFSATNPAAGYQLMAIEASDVTDNTVAVEEIPAGVPQSFVLKNNYPNPFNPSTTIVYGLPVQSRVTVKIYSLLGQEMRTLVDDVQGASYHRLTWDGTDNSGRHVSSGVYFVRIAAEPLTGSGSPFVQAKKMVLMK